MARLLQRFEGSDLESLLSEVRGQLGEDAVITSAHKVRRGGFGGFFARQVFQVEAQIADDTCSDPLVGDAQHGDDTLVASTPGSSQSSPRSPSPPSSLLELADRVSAAEQQVAGTPQEPSDGRGEELFAEALRRAISEARSTEMAAIAPSPSAPPRIPPAPTPSRSVVAPRPHDRLASLDAALLRLPPVPRVPTRPGSVIAVVGGRDEAFGVALDLAAEMGIEEDSVMLATPSKRGTRLPASRRINDADAAEDERRSWRRRRRPTLVAVDAPLAPHNAAWARSVLDALEPTVAWGVVDATRKPQDLASWADMLGGLDVLCVTCASDSLDPETVLTLGLPVGLLDGAPATRARWNEVLGPALDAIGEFELLDAPTMAASA